MLKIAQQFESDLSSAEEIIEEARNGRMFILIDDENRENEGDLIIPAQMATPEAIAFMAKEGRGLICLAMEGDMVDRLNLPLMGQQQERMQTAFTVSIEAREGVTTGISAADRALTIQKAIAADSCPEDIVTPGHVFPLRARAGGVLIRAGHTEAAVDVSRLAGLRAAGVICEIMKDDGTMARLNDLIPYAKRHGMKIGTIEDLIAYRRRTEKIIQQISQTDFNSRWANNCKLHTYKNILDETEHLAIVIGDISKLESVPVRVHVENTITDLLGAEASPLDLAMKRISEKGAGVLVLIRDHNRKDLLQEKRPPEYGIGSQILYDLGVRTMTVLTNHPGPVIGIDAYNLSISAFESF